MSSTGAGRGIEVTSLFSTFTSDWFFLTVGLMSVFGISYTFPSALGSLFKQPNSGKSDTRQVWKQEIDQAWPFS